MMTIITIEEHDNPYDSSKGYQANVIFNHDDKFPLCTIKNPFSAQQETDLKWYFDEYPKEAE